METGKNTTNIDDELVDNSGIDRVKSDDTVVTTTEQFSHEVDGCVLGVIADENTADLKALETSDVVEELDFDKSERKRFGFKPKEETNSQKMKRNIKKEQLKENIQNKKNFLKRTFGSLEFYGKISKFLDFAFNFSIIASIGVSIYFTLYFLINENPIMVLAGSLVVWLLVKLNKEIQ